MTPDDHDVVVVGAGFAGLYSIFRMRALGLRVQCFEAGDGVGGTWFWNRYPGARCDVESFDYSYSFSAELQQEWEWTERYAPQAEILRYANHVADRFDLRPHIEFETRVTAAHFDESAGRWTVTTEHGATHTATFCIMASGVLSHGKDPDIPGIDTFAGPTLRTSRWPQGGADLRGRRVGVIGTGSTAVQAIPVIAQDAAHLTVFQRTPNFSVPARNRMLTAEEIREAKATYPERRAAGLLSVAGIPGDPPERSALEVSGAERRAVYEAGWAKGGGPAMLRSFADLMKNADANATAADFVRARIAELVDDPEIAERLTPRDHPLGTKRICVDTDYFATYNRDNVTLVDLRATPIEAVVPQGVRTADGTVHELDVLILAIGFDAITGALLNIDVRGRDGLTIQEKWSAGPRTYLGLMIEGFPNLFTIAGPGSPAVLGNVVHFIEQHVDWIARCIAHLRTERAATIEAGAEAEDEWVAHVNDLAEETLFPRAGSWFMGANVPGKPRQFMPYVGGSSTYRGICDDVASNGYTGFVLRHDRVEA